MAGQKRSRSGEPKVQSKPSPEQPHDTTMTDTPPCGQALPSPKEADTKAQAKTPRIKAAPYNTPNPRTHNPTTATLTTTSSPTSAHLKNTALKHTYHTSLTTLHTTPTLTKRPLLPPTAKISKRPLLRPAIPTPFASASHPKVLYITRSSPFIPSCKRIRALLTQIAKRATQSATEHRGRGSQGKARGRRLEANGRLSAQDVEASIALASARRGGGLGLGGEEVYVKATGRAIPRALELGVKFQAEEDCRVRVEMGSVKAIDDVEVVAGAGAEGEESRGEEVEEEVPETRIRTLSTVTVCIGLV